MGFKFFPVPQCYSSVICDLCCSHEYPCGVPAVLGSFRCSKLNSVCKIVHYLLKMIRTYSRHLDNLTAILKYQHGPVLHGICMIDRIPNGVAEIIPH